MTQGRKCLVPNNHVIPRRTGADVLDRNTAETLLNEPNVGLRVRRQVLVLHCTHGVALPARQSDVLNLDFLELLSASGKRVINACAIGQDVRNADLDLVEVIEDVEFGQVQRGVVVDGLGVAAENKVEPATAAATSGGHAEFAAGTLQLVAVLIELFGGEGAGADAGGVGLDDADDVGDASGVQRQTLDGTAEAGGRGGDEGVGTVVKVEHERVGTFNQSVGGVLVLLQEGKLVNDVGLQDLAEFLSFVNPPFPNSKKRKTNLEKCNLILNIILQLPKSRAITRIQSPQLALKKRLIENLTNPHTPPRRLITIARSNTLTRSTNLATAQLRLLKTVHNRVQVKADVGAVRDEDALAGAGQTLLLQGGQFLEEAGNVHDGAGADQINALGGDKAGREDMEVVGDVFVDDSVTGVCPGKPRLIPVWISFAYR